MEYYPIDIKKKFKLINDYWAPKIIGKSNNYLIKLVKIKGDFTWHTHDETDEVFIVNKGNFGLLLETVMLICMKDNYLWLKKGRNINHMPRKNVKFYCLNQVQL